MRGVAAISGATNARAAGGGAAAASARTASRTTTVPVSCQSGQCRPEPGRGAPGRGRGGRGGRSGGRRGPEVNERQVAWEAPMRPDPVVAIVGGGLSGLACGQVRG
jgi:hypothetical protein